MASYRLLFLIKLIFVLFSQIQSYSLQSACELAVDPESCHSSLVQNPRSLRAGAKNLTTISLEMSLANVERVYNLIPPLGWVSRAFDGNTSRAIENCLTFYGLAIEHMENAQLKVNRSSLYFLKWSHAVYIQTLLSAALTDQRTCLSGLQQAHVNLSQFTFTTAIHNASVAVSNSLALIKKLWISGKAPVNHKRRLLSDGDDLGLVEDGFSWWASRSVRRKLLESYRKGSSSADVTVAQDGSGDYTTISQAINAAPENSPSKYVIHVREGVYKESFQVPSSKPNIMLVGDGKDATVITSNSGVADGLEMTETATIKVFANGFVARDMTIENTAGPEKKQALALLVVSDMAAFFRCKIMGYQDTLYAHSLHQFYRECDIYGTVDFICGNAAAVFQKCNIVVREPVSGQQNVITAQDRNGPNENTAIVIDNCKIIASSELSASDDPATTFLGRPWGQYSRTVYMNSYLGSLIDPKGWFPWPGRDSTRTVYYGEYQNTGPGADTSQRIKWPGFHVMTSSNAQSLTASALLHIDQWLPSTGIPSDPSL